MYYLNCFLIYSILGYLFETVIAFITKDNFKSGIMFGPWTPIYGLGTVIILVVSKYLFKNLHFNQFIEAIIVFIILSIFLSIIELIGGVLIEKIFGEVFWSYKYQKYNIGNYISIEMTLIWGIASILFIYIINPLLKNIVNSIPSLISFTILFIMFIDLVITTIKKI